MADIKRRTSLVPFLIVGSAVKAIEFYKKAFDALEIVRYDQAPGKTMAGLSIEGAEFWVGDEELEFNNRSAETIGGSPVRMVLTVDDPDIAFSRAQNAGATVICPVTKEESWRIGKLVDPFGHIWEIGHPLGGE
jgi:PhnB protein